MSSILNSWPNESSGLPLLSAIRAASSPAPIAASIPRRAQARWPATLHGRSLKVLSPARVSQAHNSSADRRGSHCETKPRSASSGACSLSMIKMPAISAELTRQKRYREEQMSSRFSLVGLGAAAFLAVAGVSLGAAGADAKELIMYTGQTSPQFVTTRGTMLFAQKVEELTKGEVTVRVRLGGSLSIPASNMTQAVSENVVQLGEDVFFAGS